ncbi:MAG: hypothetical protein ACO3C6_05660, partial [Steroidobacteraceae bacterium]
MRKTGRIVTAALAAAFNSLVFRWESSEPVDLKKLAIAIGGGSRYTAQVDGSTIRLVTFYTAAGDVTLTSTGGEIR